MSYAEYLADLYNGAPNGTEAQDIFTELNRYALVYPRPTDEQVAEAMHEVLASITLKDPKRGSPRVIMLTRSSRMTLTYIL